MKYRRDYCRRCERCGRPIVGAARNQRFHDPCKAEGDLERRRLRYSVRRAKAGRHLYERTPAELYRIRRKRPTPRTRPWFKLLVCADCGEEFVGGCFGNNPAKRCEGCLRVELKRQARASWRRRKYGRAA